jgi:predicted enzyme related to lactoylglutathione lyase
MAAVLHEIVIDCEQPERVARFWGEVLGWEPHDNGEAWWMGETGDPSQAPLLVFVPVPEKKSVKNRLHLDVCPKGQDQDAELDRLTGLGATLVDVGQGDARWAVLADPEGNEFCLLARRVD